MNVAEDFEELLSDKMPELAQQFVRSKRALLENGFTEFVSISFLAPHSLGKLLHIVYTYGIMCGKSNQYFN